VPRFAVRADRIVRMIRRVNFALPILLFSAVVLRGDDAIRRDGSRVAGILQLSEAGRFTFQSGGRNEPITDLEIVRFAAKSPAIAAAPLWHQVRLGNGERLLGTLLKLDATQLQIRTSWIDSLAIPRSAVERVTNAPGELPVFFDAFQGDLAAWTRTGNPSIAAGKLSFGRPGQSVASALKTPLAAGQVEIGFESEKTATRRITLDLEFSRDGRSEPVRMELIGPRDHHTVVSSVPATREQKVRRTTGPARATIEFDREHLDVFVGNLVLWAQNRGPGELHGIKLSSEGDGLEEAQLHHILVTKPRRVEDPRPWGDLTTDAIRSPDGDETYGKLSEAGPKGVVLELKEKPHASSWPDVAEFTFRKTAIPTHATDGEHVEAKIRSVGATRDVLVGAVKTLDAKGLVLSHPILGELTIPRDRLEELRLLFHGRQIPVDATPRHLGDREAFGFAVPKPEGLRFSNTIAIKTASTAGFVVVDAAHLDRKGAPVEVLINDEVIGELNRLADRDDGLVHSYRLSLPALRAGKIEIAIRLRTSPDRGPVKGIDLRAVRLELHDER
jgi:hypothetical protein